MYVPAEQHHDAMIAWLAKRGFTAWEYAHADEYRVMTPSRSREWPLEWREAQRTGKWP